MTRDLPLHVEVRGPDGGSDIDNYVLIHGYGASGFSWRHWTPRLAEHARVFVVDLKGFGRAPKPRDHRYAPTDQAHLIHRLIDEHGLSKVTLVGHSLGGGVALLAALRMIDADRSRLRRMVLVAGAAYPQRLPPFVGLANIPRVSSFLFRLVGARRIVAGVLRSVVHEPSSVTAEQILGYSEPLESREALPALLDAARQIVPPDIEGLTARYREIDVPTLLLWGRQDRVVPLEVGRRLHAALPRARLHVMERCGHLPQEERPHESYALLRAFLAESERSAAGD